jgi:hypothetical protein
MRGHIPRTASGAETKQQAPPELTHTHCAAPVQTYVIKECGEECRNASQDERLRGVEKLDLNSARVH